MRPAACAALALLAGCLAAPPAPAPAAPPILPGPLFLPPVAIDADDPGAEPVVAVAADGTIYVEGVGADPLDPAPRSRNVNKAWRSTDGGSTWTDVTPPLTGQEASFDGFLAVAPDGTVYVVNVAGATFQLWRSDDRGATWILLPTPRLPLLMHRNWVVPVGAATLHAVQEALPPGFLAGLPVPAGPQGGLWYIRSDDRGLTWTLPRQIDPLVNFAGQGNLAVDASGRRLWVPRYADARGDDPAYRSGHWYLVASEDGGDTWERREMFDLGAELASAVEPLAVDPAGTLYFAWSELQNGTSRLRYVASADGGRGWGPPRAVFPGAGAQAMPWIAARAAGELGLVWFQADAPGSAGAVAANWTVAYALVAGADGDAPRVHAAVAAPEPVHRGNICAKGPACRTGEDRRLLDYPWMAFGPGGDAHLAFPSTAWERPSAFAAFAREASPFGLPLGA